MINGLLHIIVSINFMWFWQTYSAFVKLSFKKVFYIQLLTVSHLDRFHIIPYMVSA